MSEYKGYQIRVNGLKLPNINDGTNIFVIGSYACKRYYPVLSEWTDANGKTHREVSETKKTEIKFTIKEHSLEQHAMLEPLLRDNENISVDFWDDNVAEYRSGKFFINDVEAVTSISDKNTIYYDALDIVLTEY